MTTPTGGDLASQVLALGRQLARAEMEIERLTTEQEALPLLHQRLATLTTRLDRLADGDADGGDAEPLWDWTSMSRADAEEAWIQLSSWVDDVLGGVYNAVGGSDVSGTGRTVPVCWYQHRDLLTDLSWLCQEWWKIYTAPAGVPARAGDWHERHLPGVLARAKQGSASGCNRGHTDYRNSTPSITLQEAIQADLARRS